MDKGSGRVSDLRYLQLLARQYPNTRAASSEIINLQAILNLPKGTEHFHVRPARGVRGIFTYPQQRVGRGAGKDATFSLKTR